MKKRILSLSIILIATSTTLPVGTVWKKVPSKQTIKTTLRNASYLLSAGAALSWCTNQSSSLTEGLFITAAGTSLLSQGLHEEVIEVQKVNANNENNNNKQAFRGVASTSPKYFDMNLLNGTLLTYIGTKMTAKATVNAMDNKILLGTLAGMATTYYVKGKSASLLGKVYGFLRKARVPKKYISFINSKKEIEKDNEQEQEQNKKQEDEKVD